MPARRDEDPSTPRASRDDAPTPPPPSWSRELQRPPATPRAASAPAPLTPPPKVKARQKLRNLVRKHLAKIKTARSPRQSRDSDSEDDLPKVKKYERLERAVRRQLAKGKVARRKLYELRHTIERRKTRRRARAGRDACLAALRDAKGNETEAIRALLAGRAAPKTLSGYASEGPPGTPPQQVLRRQFATEVPAHRRSGSVSSLDSDDDSSDDDLDGLALALKGVDCAALASHLSLVTLGLVGFDLVSNDERPLCRLGALIAAAACWLCHVSEVKNAAVRSINAVLEGPPEPRIVREPVRRAPSLAEVPRWTVPREEDSSRENTWRAAPGATFQLRGLHYLKDRVKGPSLRATYDVSDVRVLRSPAGAMPDLLTHHPSLRGEARTLNGLPTTLALNIAAPCEAPSLTGYRPESPCWVLLLVCKLSDHARHVAEHEPDVAKWPAGLRLCRRWLRDAPSDPYLCARLKGVFQVRALDGEKLPRVFEKWSGKPVLMAAAGALSRRAGLAKFSRGHGFVEVHLDIGESFSYMGRGAVYLMMSKLATLDADVCFTLEGRADDELPEVVFGAASFTALDLEKKFAQLRGRAATLG